MSVLGQIKAANAAKMAEKVEVQKVEHDPMPEMQKMTQTPTTKTDVVLKQALDDGHVMSLTAAKIKAGSVLSKKVGRPPKGEVAMTAYERVKSARARKKAGLV